MGTSKSTTTKKKRITWPQAYVMSVAAIVSILAVVLSLLTSRSASNQTISIFVVGVFLIWTVINIAYAFRQDHHPVRALAIVMGTVVALILVYAGGYAVVGLCDTQPWRCTFALGPSIYFSIVTCTSVGYGDLQPIADEPYGRALAASEALFGYIYLGILIGLVVQLSSYRSREDKKPSLN